jgi:uncharacterized protein (DUF433 family)
MYRPQPGGKGCPAGDVRDRGPSEIGGDIASRPASIHVIALKHQSGQSIMADHPRITLDPDVLVGKPVLHGTRLSVEFIIGLMADGWNEGDILENYPGVTHDDLMACLAYARDALSSEKVFPSAA